MTFNSKKTEKNSVSPLLPDLVSKDKLNNFRRKFIDFSNLHDEINDYENNLNNYSNKEYITKKDKM